MLWCVRFRYIPPEMMMAPGYLIPTEQMGIRAESADEAWSKFLSDIHVDQQSWYRKEEIYLSEK